MKKLTILGSTGSIGVSTLDVVAAQPDMFKVVALTAGNNLELLKKQIETFQPELVSVLSADNAKALSRMLTGKKPQIMHGVEGMIAAATASETTMVVAAIVGAAGLVPTTAAIMAGKDVALANKETLVTAGHLVMDMVRKKGVKLYPVDSEHCAVFQSMVGHRNEDIARVILTASGGPFLKWGKEQLKVATVKDALNHPNWSMGKKITVDSATMMNKGLEVIEARWLFDIPVERIATRSPTPRGSLPG
jgi:1-deoxy-D-xylulose-5-phosphate reductoisomerase